MQYSKKDILHLIKSRIKQKNPTAEVILFGSRARNQERAESDWDILILLDQPEVSRKLQMEYRHELNEIELETNESISTFVFSKDIWESKHKVTPFYQSIKEEGIYL